MRNSSKEVLQKQPLFIFMIGVFILSNALFNKFAFDDYDQIINNPFIHSLKNIPTLFYQSSWNDPSIGIYYKPLMTLTYALLYALFGPNPLPFHLVQILIHIANALLSFYICKFFFKKQTIPFVLALVFLVHPINADTVIYSANLQDTLFLFFGLLGLIVISQKKLTIQRYLLLAVFLLLSLLSKETGLLFIVIAPIYRFFFLRTNKTIKQYNNEVLRVAVVAVVIFTAYLILRLKALGLAFYSELFPIAKLSTSQRFAHIPILIFYYLKTAFFPKDLATGQEWTLQSFGFSHFFAPLIVDSLFLVAILVLGELVYKKSKDSYSSYLFFLIWFAIGLLPLIHLIPLDGTVADRWFYFPIIGLLGLLGISIECLTKPKQKRFIAKLAIIVLILFAARTFIRTFDWRTGLTIARHDSQVTENFILEGELGYKLIEIGSYDEALSHMEKSIRLNPKWWSSWNGLGILYRHMGYKKHDKSFIDTAKLSFDKAIEYSNYFHEPIDNQAELLFYFKGPKATIDFINQASKKTSLDSLLWRYLALSEYQLNNHQKALEAAKQAYLLDKSNTENYNLYQSLKKNQKIPLPTPSY